MPFEPISVLVAGLPPSDNTAYRGGSAGSRRQRFLTTKARVWKRDVTTQVSITTRDWRGDLTVEPPLLRVELVFMMSLRTKAGELRRWDVSSHQKITVDAVFDALGVDDLYCGHLDVRKEDADALAATYIRVTPLA